MNFLQVYELFRYSTTHGRLYVMTCTTGSGFLFVVWRLTPLCTFHFL